MRCLFSFSDVAGLSFFILVFFLMFCQTKRNLDMIHRPKQEVVEPNLSITLFSIYILNEI